MLKEWYLDIDGQFTYGLLDSGTELTRAPCRWTKTRYVTLLGMKYPI